MDGRWLSERFGLVVFGITAIAMAARLPVGLDLSDESYYAIFLDDWLKGGIASSTLLTLHQTAALLLYPFARLYVAIAGSSDGLYLALRIIFLIGSFSAACVWILFLRKLGAGLAAWCTGAAIIAFIPFGLPAPSYNTIGQQSLMIACAAFGLTILGRDAVDRRSWLVISAIAASVCSVAYPPLTPALGIMVLLGFKRPALGNAAGSLSATVVAGLLAWGIVIWVLTPQRLWDSAVYLSAINDAGGVGKKLEFSASLLSQHRAFLLICVAAAVVGILRRRLGSVGAAFGVATLLLATYAIPTVLFAKSHDAVTVALLCGLSLMSGLKRDATVAERTVAVIFTTSLVAAAAAMATATFAVYNICIGGLPGAALALAAPVGGRRQERVAFSSAAPALAMLPSLLATSFFAPYGEIPSTEPRHWVRSGFFKGVLAKERDTAPVELVRTQVEPLFGTERTLAVFARLPGLALASTARLKAPTSFPLMPDVPKRGLEATHGFYADSKHRPAIVLIYRDPYFATVNPMAQDFVRWYREERRLKTALGEIEVYSRR